MKRGFFVCWALSYTIVLEYRVQSTVLYTVRFEIDGQTFCHASIIVIPTAVAPLRYAQARPARAEPSVPSAALPPLPLRGVAAVRLSEGEQEASRSRGT